jgi:hypothetical protein
MSAFFDDGKLITDVAFDFGESPVFTALGS